MLTPRVTQPSGAPAAADGQRGACQPSGGTAGVRETGGRQRWVPRALGCGWGTSPAPPPPRSEQSDHAAQRRVEGCSQCSPSRGEARSPDARHTGTGLHTACSGTAATQRTSCYRTSALRDAHSGRIQTGHRPVGPPAGGGAQSEAGRQGFLWGEEVLSVRAPRR